MTNDSVVSCPSTSVLQFVNKITRAIKVSGAIGLSLTAAQVVYLNF